MNTCEKEITGYSSKVKKISTHMPHGSKYFGMAFIPEGEAWPVCLGCKREMILMMQLQISDLPEAPQGECFDDNDMFQVFTCAYIDPHSSDEHWNAQTKQPTVKGVQNCYNAYRYSSKAHLYRPFIRPDESFADHGRFDSPSQDHAGENWFKYVDPDDDIGDPEYYCGGEAYSPFRFLARAINIKDKEPTKYQVLPWVDAYHLKLNDEGKYVDALESAQVSQHIKDYLYFWIDTRAYLVNDISTESLKITDWKKFSYICGMDQLSHKLFNGCLSYEDKVPLEKLPENYTSFNYLGALTINKYSLFGRNDGSVYPDCCYCGKPMTLLCSFGLYHDASTYEEGPLFGLYYCQETANLQVNLMDERRD